MKTNDLPSKNFPEHGQVMAYCPKCGAFGMDDGTQCEGACPMDDSPHFDQALSDKFMAEKT